MPNTQERRDHKLEDMSDEELRQILRDDASNSAGEDTDMEYILHAMEVLATRRKEHGEGRSPAEALDSFNKNYCTDREDNLISEKVRGATNKHAKILWKRFAAVAAVFALVIAFSTATVSAWDFDLWEIISEWSEESFRFGFFGKESEQNEASPPCASLQAALDDHEITQRLAPTWLPDGYIENDVDVFESPKQRIFCAQYQNGDTEIVIRITDYLGKDPSQVEQSGVLLEVYSSNATQYYIFENIDQLQTVWTKDSFECSITSSLSVDEIKIMIDSIEKG